jgi:hypothetical protein
LSQSGYGGNPQDSKTTSVPTQTIKSWLRHGGSLVLAGTIESLNSAVRESAINKTRLIAIERKMGEIDNHKSCDEFSQRTFVELVE